MDRYKIGSGTLSLIMERYHAGEIPIEELQMMPPKEVELLFYPQKNIKKKDIPLPDFQYYYDRIHANYNQLRKIGGYEQQDNEKSFCPTAFLVNKISDL